ncbi:MAG: hypothetical protein HKM02_11965 [Pseudomonadales bacterium]|nr:hypothetical protein [Pseudomonadales bacterium]
MRFFLYLFVGTWVCHGYALQAMDDAKLQSISEQDSIVVSSGSSAASTSVTAQTSGSNTTTPVKTTAPAGIASSQIAATSALQSMVPGKGTDVAPASGQVAANLNQGTGSAPSFLPLSSLLNQGGGIGGMLGGNTSSGSGANLGNAQFVGVRGGSTVSMSIH